MRRRRGRGYALNERGDKFLDHLVVGFAVVVDDHLTDRARDVVDLGPQLQVLFPHSAGGVENLDE